MEYIPQCPQTRRFQSQDWPVCRDVLDLVKTGDNELFIFTDCSWLQGHMGLSMGDAYFCKNVNKVRNYVQNKKVTAKWWIIYLQTNKIIMLAFQGDMVGCTRGFTGTLYSALLRTEQKTPFHEHNIISTDGIYYEENWERSWRRIRNLSGPKPNLPCYYLLLKLHLLPHLYAMY